MPTYRTHRVEIEGRTVPVQLTPAMERVLRFASARLDRHVDADPMTRLALIKRKLVRQGPGQTGAYLTEDGAVLARALRDGILEGGWRTVTVEYRQHPTVAEHDRVRIVTVHQGTDRWRVVEVKDGAAYIRLLNEPEGAQGMWCSLDYLHDVKVGQ